MSTTMPKLAFVFAAFFAAPITASFADVTSPNAIDNAMVDQGAAPQPSTGTYDNADQYRDSKGFPQPGWQYLSLPPS
jgi:hypothetical protein